MKLLGHGHGRCQRLGFVTVQVRQHDHELVTPHPCNGCRLIGQRIGQALGNQGQQLISKLMPMCVVEQFEVIQIDEYERTQ